MIKEKKQTKKINTGNKKLKPIKGFKSVDWVRKVRNEIYEKNKDLNMNEYVKKILNNK